MTTVAPNRSLVTAIRRELAAAADPVRAAAMQAYMKSAMPYRGVPSPGQRAIYRVVFPAHPLESFDAWQATCLELWRAADYREERYAAIELAGHRLYRAYQAPEALPMFAEMITAGAWWDHVDAVAIHLVGPMLPRHRGAVEPMLTAWRTDPSMWRRRTSIIAQVGLKAETDTEFLAGSIEPNLADREFFIRKAIGWALRAYAWVDPDWVRSYVARNGERMSGLSRREALKNIRNN
jgi:3-methyladenine DNA glycosylase AlkD